MTKQRTTARQPPSVFGKARRAPRPADRKNVAAEPKGKNVPGGSKTGRQESVQPQRRPR